MRPRTNRVTLAVVNGRRLSMPGPLRVGLSDGAGSGKPIGGKPVSTRRELDETVGDLGGPRVRDRGVRSCACVGSADRRLLRRLARRRVPKAAWPLTFAAQSASSWNARRRLYWHFASRRTRKPSAGVGRTMAAAQTRSAAACSAATALDRSPSFWKVRRGAREIASSEQPSSSLGDVPDPTTAAARQVPGVVAVHALV